MPSQILHLDYGAIGNGRVVALISPRTRMEWLCLPRFDSPSVFAEILDREKGGSFWFEAAGKNAEYKMEYVANTNVLRTRVKADDGVFEVYDFAPFILTGLSVEAPVEIHRLLVPVEGSPRVRVHFDPRPDYGRVKAGIIRTGENLEVTGGPAKYFLRSNVPAPFIDGDPPIHLDQPKYFVFKFGEPSDIDSASTVQKSLNLTIATWREWAKTCALPSFADAAVLRSGLCLKLHTSVDTGAIIAAATTSIPEALGTERTWDYRYCWLRDAAFVAEALRRLGHLSEGEAFLRFLRDVAAGGMLQPVFGIGGERFLPEEQLDHLSGFGGSRPVRIGNAAYLQDQHDLTGEMILCLDTMMTDLRVIHDDQSALMKLVEQTVEKAIVLSPLEDTGPWEFRTLHKHYTFSKVLCWVAANRGAGLARLCGKEDLAKRWEAWAAIEKERILKHGFNEKLGFFTQTLDGVFPDASLLLLPTFGIVDARDPRFVSTVRAYEERLVVNGLMLRYRNADDFGETTSAFLACSFWWAEALAMIGELEKAVEVFNRIERLANPVGLFSEDADPQTGKLLGNFPQTFTHVALIHAAITIGELLEARDARFRAWT